MSPPGATLVGNKQPWREKRANMEAHSWKDHEDPFFSASVSSPHAPTKPQACLPSTHAQVTTGSAGQTWTSSPAADLHLKLLPLSNRYENLRTVFPTQFRAEEGVWGTPT